jgi:WD40 repeat protein
MDGAMEGDDTDSEAPTHFGRYVVQATLGDGSTGVVYRGRDETLNRDVAIKVLHRHLLESPKERETFLAEARLLAALDHPVIVPVYDVGQTEDGLCYLVAKLVPGTDLRVRLRQGKPTRGEAVAIVARVAEALDYAHRQHLIHRDIKPANILLDQAGNPVLVDFGLALREQDFGMGPTFVGTVPYMSPEQARHEGHCVDLRTDIYALGVVLYEMLAGRRPFVSDSKAELLEMIRNQPAPSLSTIDATIPPELDRICLKALANRREDRYASARAFAKDLRRWQATAAEADRVDDAFTSRSARTVSFEGRPEPVGSPPPVRVRWGLGVILSLAVLLVAWVAWSASRHNTPDRPSEPDKTVAAPPPAVETTPHVIRPSRTLRLHAAGVMAVAFSPDGKILASAGKDRTIYLWDTATWKPSAPMTGHTGDVVALVFSPDGKQLASASSAADTCAVRLWAVASAKPLKTLGGANRGMWGIAFSPDGKTLVCGGWETTLHFFTVETGQETQPILRTAPRFLRGVSFSSDRKTVVAGGDGPIRLWDASTREEIPSSFPQMCPMFFPDGKRIAGWSCEDGRVTIADAGRVVAVWRAHPHFIEGLTVSPDGRFLASVGDEGLAKIWNAANQDEVAQLVGHRGSVYAASFTPDGQKLATAGQDDWTVRLWDLPRVCHVVRAR